MCAPGFEVVVEALEVEDEGAGQGFHQTPARERGDVVCEKRGAGECMTEKNRTQKDHIFKDKYTRLYTTSS